MKKFVKKHQFKILVGTSIVVLIILYLTRDVDETGTWSLYYHYDPPAKNSSSGKRFVKESKGELECRRVLEYLFRKPFPNQRPHFLTNTVTGKSLELDCYNAEIGLAVEYNGRQHYEYTPGMHKTHDAFRAQQYRDEMKKRLCLENGILLISVPYNIHTDTIETFLSDKLRENGFKIDF